MQNKYSMLIPLSQLKPHISKKHPYKSSSFLTFVGSIVPQGCGTLMQNILKNSSGNLNSNTPHSGSTGLSPQWNQRSC